MSHSASEPTWLNACVVFARAHGIVDDVLEALDTFRGAVPRGGPPPPAELPWSQSFEALEESVTSAFDTETLAQDLAEELDGAQPGLFARRVAATDAILGRRGTPRARILRVGLHVRLQGILAALRPRARRVRALADFYYSLAVQPPRVHGVNAGHALDDLVQHARWAAVADGIEHTTLAGSPDDMPTHVNLLRIDPGRVRISVENLRDAALDGHGFARAVAGRAAAAVSGGFFLYSEDDIEPPSARHDPVGLLASRGEVHGPPVFHRAAFLVSEAGEAAIHRIGMTDVSTRIGPGAAVPTGYWNRADAEVGPDAPSVAVVGSQVVAVGRGLRVPLNGFVATLAGEDAVNVVVGAAVHYDVPRLPGGRRVEAAVAGGPMLVRDGRPVLDMESEQFWGSAPPITFSQDETGDRNLLARLAVGLDGAGRVIAAAVDGRNVERALGMTLGGVARLMILLGCTRALNLDGGSSKRMLVEGRIVDLPSTEIVASAASPTRVRPVHTAILFQQRGAPDV